MITFDSKFNFDGKDWTVNLIVSVQYVNYHGHVVTVDAYADDGELYTIDLLANGTPVGYSNT